MNEQLKQLQVFMKTAPAGVSYGGPVDGENNPQLQSAVSNLQNVIRTSLPDSSKAKSYTILSGDTVVRTIADIQSLLLEIGKNKKEESDKPKGNTNIKAVQEVFNSNPFGIQYSGPKDGVVNSDLIQKARALEQSIVSLTGANISGKITDGNTIITSASDLQKTFVVISDYQKFIQNKK